MRTAAGELFDIDTALRPNGNSGLLVTSIESFAPARASSTAFETTSSTRGAGLRAKTPSESPGV